MRVTILDNCRADGRHHSIGDQPDLPEPIARELIAIGRAEAEGVTVEGVAAFSTAPEPDPAPAPKPVRRPAPVTTKPKES